MSTAWAAACFAVDAAELGQDVGAGQVGVAQVQVVVASHRPARQGDAGALLDQALHEPPHEAVAEFGFDLAGRAVDRDEGLVDDDHERRVVPPPPTTGVIGVGDGLGEAVGLGVPQDRFDPPKRGDPPSTVSGHPPTSRDRSAAPPDPGSASPTPSPRPRAARCAPSPSGPPTR